jgi:cysteine synthase
MTNHIEMELIRMQRTQSSNQSIALNDYAIVKSYISKLRAPFYDYDTSKALHATPVSDITDKLGELSTQNPKIIGNRFYLKEEYKNQLTESVKGRAVASMVLHAIRNGQIYSSGSRKVWIEPTSGNTGKGLAEIAKLLGIEFTAVLSRLDVSEEIKASMIRSGGRILTIGSEYGLSDLESLSLAQGCTVVYYWTMLAGLDEKSKSILIKNASKSKSGSSVLPKSEEGESNGRDDGISVKQLEGGFLIDPLLPLATESSKTPIIDRVRNGEFEGLKVSLQKLIPELNNPKYIVTFVCNHGNSSMAVNTLLSQLGFNNVCSLKGGMDEIRALEGGSSAKSDEFCPVPGASIARSSIEFVKRLVQNNPERYHSFMQYENEENLMAHLLTTGPELMSQIPELDVVVCTFGTGGTATGLARYFREKGVQTYVAFPENPVEGIRTIRGAEGLAFFKPELYSRIIHVSNSKSDAVLMYLLSKGIAVGPSTAIALTAALDAAAGDDEKRTFAIIAADGIENYETHYKPR